MGSKEYTRPNINYLFCACFRSPLSSSFYTIRCIEKCMFIPLVSRNYILSSTTNNFTPGGQDELNM